MNPARRFALAAAASALLLLCTRAEAGPRIGFEGWGGWNRVSMTDVNDTLSSFNREYGTALAPIRDDAAWGIGLRIWAREEVLVRFGVERLAARSEDSGVEFDLGAYAITVGVSRYFPSWGRFRGGLGAAIGPYFETGGLTAPGATLAASGTGFGGHVAGEAALGIGAGFSLQGQVGYRWASIEGLRLGDNDTDITAQYSGPFVRLGVALDARKAD